MSSEIFHKTIKSIQGYRVILFLTIFFFHSSGILRETRAYKHLFAGGGHKQLLIFLFFLDLWLLYRVAIQ